jgi:hypothetical protein
MTIPVSPFQWATAPAAGDYTPPLASLVTSGYTFKAKPAHDNFNYALNLLGQWSVYLDGLARGTQPWTFAQTYNAAATFALTAAIAGNVGIGGAPVTNAPLEVWGAGSQILFGSAADQGALFASATASYFGYGQRYIGGSWIARQGKATVIGSDNAVNAFVVYGNTGLTVGSAYTPAVLLALDYTGNGTFTNNLTVNATLIAGNTGLGTLSSSAHTLVSGNNAITLQLGSSATGGLTVNQPGAALRFNGGGVGWGDVAYYPTASGTGNWGHFRFSTTGAAVNATPNANVGVGNLYANGFIGVGTNAPGCAVDSTGTFRTTGTSTPTSGVGGEFEYSGGTVYLTGFDRTGGLWRPLNLRGLTVSISPNGTPWLVAGANGVAVGNNNTGTNNTFAVYHAAASPSGIFTSSTLGGLAMYNATAGAVLLRADHTSVTGNYDGDFVVYNQYYSGAAYIWNETMRVRADGRLLLNTPSATGQVNIHPAAANLPALSLFLNGAQTSITFETGNYGFIDYLADSSQGVRLSALGPLRFGFNTNAAYGTATFTEVVRVIPSGLQFQTATSGWVDFGGTGIGAPTFVTRSAGVKILLNPNSLSASAADYAIGMESAGVWFGIPIAGSGYQFRWYGGTTPLMTLNGSGLLTVNGSVTSSGSSGAGIGAFMDYSGGTTARFFGYNYGTGSVLPVLLFGSTVTFASGGFGSCAIFNANGTFDYTGSSGGSSKLSFTSGSPITANQSIRVDTINTIINAASTGGVYLAYDSGANGVFFGNGASSYNASVNGNGQFSGQQPTGLGTAAASGKIPVCDATGFLPAACIPGIAAGQRNTVIQGHVNTTSGVPDYITGVGNTLATGAGLIATAVPHYVTFAAGYRSNGTPQDFPITNAADIASVWTALPVSATSYLALQRNSGTGAVTAVATIFQPFIQDFQPNSTGGVLSSAPLGGNIGFALDGIAANKFVSGGTSGTTHTFFQQDYQAPATFTSLSLANLFFTGTAGVAAAIETSNDAVTWTLYGTAFTLASAAGTTVTQTATVTARYWRVRITGAYGVNGYFQFDDATIVTSALPAYTNNCYWYDPTRGQTYQWNGTNWNTAAQLVFVGTAVTNGTNITSVTSANIGAITQAGNIIAPGNSSFSVTIKTFPALAAATNLKLPFDTVLIDTQGEIDTTNYRFVAKQAGTYIFRAQFGLTTVNTAGYVSLALLVNGVQARNPLFQYSPSYVGTTFIFFSNPTKLKLNAGDYVECVIAAVGGATNVTAGPLYTLFEGEKIG